ncbi:unnamed protein product [Hydatigera taeniaeformis]|uniref:TPR_REGION domain-containing protein n=1 Tax=Hydatigena taeniaeformis TaxID=6205 RepID=A0A0R3X8X6_HYDTA|nr:unnamed protein product [Hydatigera taeniaeformis]
MQDFLDDLKVYLIGEGRRVLSSVVEREREGRRKDVGRNAPSVGGLTQSDMSYFAEEAEALGNALMANYYIQHMLAQNPKSKETLIAAGSFFARVDNREAALVCLRRCLEMTPNDVEILWKVGTLLTEMGKLDEAKSLLEAASDIAPSHPTVRIILSAYSNHLYHSDLFYESLYNTWNFERTLTITNQLQSQHSITSKAVKWEDQEEADAKSEYANCADLIGTIDRLLELKASALADVTLARLLLHIKQYRCTLGDVRAGEDLLEDLKLPDGVTRSSKAYRDYMHDLSAYHRLVACHMMQSRDEEKRLLQAQMHLKAALQAQPECVDNWACMGRLCYQQGNKEGAVECFERAMQLETWSSKQHRGIQLQLARCYAEMKEFEKSKAQYLRCCSEHPTPVSWKGVGVACFRMSRWEEAEVALQESNRLNTRDADVWAYLAMICLKTNKRPQAEMCLQSVHMVRLSIVVYTQEVVELRPHSFSFL